MMALAKAAIQRLVLRFWFAQPSLWFKGALK